MHFNYLISASPAPPIFESRRDGITKGATLNNSNKGTSQLWRWWTGPLYQTSSKIRSTLKREAMKPGLACCWIWGVHKKSLLSKGREAKVGDAHVCLWARARACVCGVPLPEAAATGSAFIHGPSWMGTVLKQRLPSLRAHKGAAMFAERFLPFLLLIVFLFAVTEYPTGVTSGTQAWIHS